MRWILGLAVLVACGGGDDTEMDASASSDAAVDSTAPPAMDATTPPEDGASEVDAFTPEAPPLCPARVAIDPPACGSGGVSRDALIPGAAGSGYDAALAAKALDFDRGFHAIVALYTGVNTEVNVPEASDRELIRRFVQDEDGWDLAASAGKPVEDMVQWRKVAGAYGGAGAAADAYRYAVLRDEGAPCDEVERARGHLRNTLDALHRATAITGVPGVVARGYQRNDVPEQSVPLTPLFDGSGNPLPEEKNNGTWRADNSGEYPEYDWEDSCSRDMLIGWVLGMAAAWEAITGDETIEDSYKTRLATDANAIAHMLMEVGEEGYDLEIHDADGRLTYHAYLHEKAVDTVYVPFFPGNGQHALMSLGIISALARISGDEEVASYLYNELIRRRAVHEVAREWAGIIDLGTMSNFSNYNMAFTGGWLATRFICDPDALETVREAVSVSLYDMPGEDRHPVVIAQSFFDFVHIGARAGATAFSDGNRADLDQAALDRAMQTLVEFSPPPYWNEPVENCDESEIEAGVCTLRDGVTEVTLLGYVGRNDRLIASTPIPMRLRPVSNYHWRSDPYRPNSEGNGNALYPGVDFRLAYWMGRYMQLR